MTQRLAVREKTCVSVGEQGEIRFGEEGGGENGSPKFGVGGAMAHAGQQIRAAKLRVLPEL